MMISKIRVKEDLKRVLRGIFEKGQYLGVDILPRHFYSEVPNIRELRKHDYWKKPYSMIGVQGAEIGPQVDFARSCCPPEVIEKLRRKRIHELANEMNGAVGFGPVEADFLYAFIHTHRPRQIFQIGCGVSTAICLMAAEDAGYQPQILCVEPYPTEFLSRLAAEGKVQLIREKAQVVDLGVIESLGSDLLFFVDSSHTLGPAGEVSRIILEMLPRLKPDAWVHFHDIMFPYDYDRRLLKSSLFFHHETTVLHAFLTGNARFKIAGSLSMLHYAMPEELARLIPRYSPAANEEGLETREGHFPSSIYLRAL